MVRMAWYGPRGLHGLGRMVSVVRVLRGREVSAELVRVPRRRERGHAQRAHAQRVAVAQRVVREPLVVVQHDPLAHANEMREMRESEKVYGNFYKKFV